MEATDGVQDSVSSAMAAQLLWQRKQEEILALQRRSRGMMRLVASGDPGAVPWSVDDRPCPSTGSTCPSPPVASSAVVAHGHPAEAATAGTAANVAGKYAPTSTASAALSPARSPATSRKLGFSFSPPTPGGDSLESDGAGATSAAQQPTPSRSCASATWSRASSPQLVPALTAAFRDRSPLRTEHANSMHSNAQSEFERCHAEDLFAYHEREEAESLRRKFAVEAEERARDRKEWQQMTRQYKEAQAKSEDRLEQTLEETRRLRAQALSEQQAVKEERSRLKAAHQRALRGMQADNDRYEELKADQGAATKKLEGELKEERRKVMELRSRRGKGEGRLRQEVAHLKSGLDELEEARDAELAALRSKCAGVLAELGVAEARHEADLLATIGSYSSELVPAGVAWAEERMACESQVVALDASRAVGAVAEDRARRAESEVGAAQLELQALRGNLAMHEKAHEAEVQEVRSANAELAKYMTERVRQATEAQTMQREVVRLQKQFLDSKAVLQAESGLAADLLLDLDSETLAAKSLQLEVADAQQERETSCRNVGELRASLDTQESKRAEAEEKMEALAVEVASARRDLAAAQAAGDAGEPRGVVSDAVMKLETEAAHAKARELASMEEVESLRNSCSWEASHMKAEKDKLVQKFRVHREKMEKDNQELQEQAEDLCNSEARLQEHVKSLREERHQERVDLREHLGKLQRRCKQLEDANQSPHTRPGRAAPDGPKKKERTPSLPRDERDKSQSFADHDKGSSDGHLENAAEEAEACDEAGECLSGSQTKENAFHEQLMAIEKLHEAEKRWMRGELAAQKARVAKVESDTKAEAARLHDVVESALERIPQQVTARIESCMWGRLEESGLPQRLSHPGGVKLGTAGTQSLMVPTMWCEAALEVLARRCDAFARPKVGAPGDRQISAGSGFKVGAAAKVSELKRELSDVRGQNKLHKASLAELELEASRRKRGSEATTAAQRLNASECKTTLRRRSRGLQSEAAEVKRKVEASNLDLLRCKTRHEAELDALEQEVQVLQQHNKRLECTVECYDEASAASVVERAALEEELRAATDARAKVAAEFRSHEDRDSDLRRRLISVLGQLQALVDGFGQDALGCAAAFDASIAVAAAQLGVGRCDLLAGSDAQSPAEVIREEAAATALAERTKEERAILLSRQELLERERSSRERLQRQLQGEQEHRAVLAEHASRKESEALDAERLRWQAEVRVWREEEEHHVDQLYEERDLWQSAALQWQDSDVKLSEAKEVLAKERARGAQISECLERANAPESDLTSECEVSTANPCTDVLPARYASTGRKSHQSIVRVGSLPTLVEEEEEPATDVSFRDDILHGGALSAADEEAPERPTLDSPSLNSRTKQDESESLDINVGSHLAAGVDACAKLDAVGLRERFRQAEALCESHKHGPALQLLQELLDDVRRNDSCMQKPQGCAHQSVEPSQVVGSVQEPEVLAYMGVALQSLGRVDESIDAYATAVARDPSLHVCHGNLAALHLYKQDLDASWHHLALATKLDPQNPAYAAIARQIEAADEVLLQRASVPDGGGSKRRGKVAGRASNRYSSQPRFPGSSSNEFSGEAAPLGSTGSANVDDVDPASR